MTDNATNALRQSKTGQGILNRSDSIKALGYFLDEFWSTPAETKA